MADIGRVQEGNTVSNFLRSRSAPQWGAIIGGGSLALLGLAQKSKSGLALALAGGTFAYLGATSEPEPREVVVHGSVLLNCSPQEAYQFWRQLEKLPRFMRRLESVTDLGGGRSRWVALGPAGTRVEWAAEITSDRPGQSISWRTLDGSDLNLDGRVEFRAAPADRGTLLEAIIHYSPAKAIGGRKLMQLLSHYPSFWVRQDLRRLKALIESGEIPTTEGQSHGPRSGLTAAMRMADPDRPWRRQSRMSEAFNAMRRIA